MRDPDQVSAEELAGAAARAGCVVSYYLGGSGLSAKVVPRDGGWGNARLLRELSALDATKPAVRAAAACLREGTDRSPQGDEIYARRVQAFIKRMVRFAREEGEIFQSSQYTMRVGYGDCDDHARLAVALLVAGGVRASLGLLHAEGKDPQHVAAVADIPGKAPVWLETTCDADFGEHPVAAATRLGILRSDIAAPLTHIMPVTTLGDLGTMSGLSSATGTTRQAVLDAFVPFTAKFEGALSFMYLDVRGLVTTGIGNLIDPIGLATSLPWRRPDGSIATVSEIEDNWHLVKGRADMASGGGVAFGRLAGNTLRLDQDGIDQVVALRFHENESILASQFPAYGSWPADAQLALHSLAWARGPANFRGGFPRLTAALLARDFRTAATQSNLAGNTTGRNAADAALFNAAADVEAGSGSPDDLHVPIPGATTVVGGSSVAASAASKIPVLLFLLAAGAAAVHYVRPDLTRAAVRTVSRTTSSLTTDVRRLVGV
jgi:hypothetical protein